jgi:Uma2 family endonuclease
MPDGITVEIDEDTDYEPDALVNCGPPASDDAVAAPQPVIVVEVLSPSTQAIDVSEKLADYFRLPSIQHYLVFRPRKHEVIHHRRVSDEIITRIINIGSIVLDPPGIAIDLADIYPAES